MHVEVEIARKVSEIFNPPKKKIRVGGAVKLKGAADGGGGGKVKMS